MYLAEQYIKDVLDNPINHCKYVKQCVNRHLSDLDKSLKNEDYPFYFDQEAAEFVIDFFVFLKHSKGEWAGQSFKLEPWQQFFLWCVFGWKKKSDNNRRFRIIYLEVPRKNGKSTLIAGSGLFALTADGEQGAEIYSAATKRDQAIITHSEATRMVKASPDLRKIITVYKNNLNIEDTASKFEPLGADADTLDGLNPHVCLIDEVHAHKSRALWDVLETAIGSRQQPLLIGITTAGYDRQSLCWELHEHTAKVLEKRIVDDSFWGVIYTIDEEDNWEDESCWKKANPNLEVSVKLDDMRHLASQAKQMPSKLNSFLRLKLNVWTQSETKWLRQDVWEANGGTIDYSYLKNRRCYGGLDLSSTTDITAWILVFPPERENEKYVILPKFFIPEENIEDRVKRDRVSYDVWLREGYVIATPGRSVNYDYVLKQIYDDVGIYDFKEIAFDRWGSRDIARKLEEDGFTMIDFGQGFQSMSPAMKDLERYLLEKKINHGNNPVLTWMSSNVVIKSDPAENIKPDKDKSTERIDGIVALIMAFSRALLCGTDSNYYEVKVL